MMDMTAQIVIREMQELLRVKESRIKELETALGAAIANFHNAEILREQECRECVK